MCSKRFLSESMSPGRYFESLTHILVLGGCSRFALEQGLTPDTWPAGESVDAFGNMAQVPIPGCSASDTSRCGHWSRPGLPMGVTGFHAQFSGCSKSPSPEKSALVAPQQSTARTKRGSGGIQNHRTRAPHSDVTSRARPQPPVPYWLEGKPVFNFTARNLRRRWQGKCQQRRMDDIRSYKKKKILDPPPAPCYHLSTV